MSETDAPKPDSCAHDRCDREVSDDDRCYWHRKERGKEPLSDDSPVNDIPDELGGAYLGDADLSDADLEGVDLSDAHLKKASLTGANLKKANLTGANLKKAKITGVNLEKAKITDSNLKGAKLINADLWKADLIGADLWGADLTSAHLPEANLTDTQLLEANLSRAHLEEANLTNADLGRAVLTYLPEASLTRAQLGGADLTDANLEKANLTGAELKGTDITDANIKKANLTNADLGRADITNANLEGAILSNADLEGANLTDANLEEANLTDTNIKDADLTSVDFLHATVENPTLNNQTELGSRLPAWFSRMTAHARAYHDVRTAASDDAYDELARDLYVLEQKARTRAAFPFEPITFLGGVLSGLFTGYGVRPRRVLGWTILFLALTTLWFSHVGVVFDGWTATHEFLGVQLRTGSAYYSVVTFVTSPPHPPQSTDLITNVLVTLETYVGTVFTVLLGYVLGNRSRV